MKRVGLTILIASTLILVLLGYWTSRRVTTRNAHTSLTAPQAIGTKPPEPAPRSGILPPVDLSPAGTTHEGATAIIKEVFNSPISFFGKVQDQDAAPIDGANVEFGAVDKFWESGSNYHATSDANGLFSINGIKGAGLTVAVSKK